MKDLLAVATIRLNISPYSSPILLVKKHDGLWRMCVDYRALIQITVKEKFIIPVINELLDELTGAQFFTKLNLHSGYHQVRKHLNDIENTAFQMHEGHYEFW